MGGEMSMCTNPFVDDDEEDEKNIIEVGSTEEKEKKRKDATARIHRYDTAARDAAEADDKKFGRSEGNRYIKNDDL